MTTESTLALVRSYYEGWQGGERYDEALLRSVFHPRLVFESPMGRRDQLDDFLPGLARFNKTMSKRQMLQLFAVGDEAAALYDCDVAAPINSLRCAEFFRVEGERISSVRLVFDATAYRIKT